MKVLNDLCGFGLITKKKGKGFINGEEIGNEEVVEFQAFDSLDLVDVDEPGIVKVSMKHVSQLKEGVLLQWYAMGDEFDSTLWAYAIKARRIIKDGK